MDRSTIVRGAQRADESLHDELTPCPLLHSVELADLLMQPLQNSRTTGIYLRIVHRGQVFFDVALLLNQPAVETDESAMFGFGCWIRERLRLTAERQGRLPIEAFAEVVDGFHDIDQHLLAKPR